MYMVKCRTTCIYPSIINRYNTNFQDVMAPLELAHWSHIANLIKTGSGKSPNLNQNYPVFSEVMWHSSDGNFTGIAENINIYFKLNHLKLLSHILMNNVLNISDNRIIIIIVTAICDWSALLHAMIFMHGIAIICVITTLTKN